MANSGVKQFEEHLNFRCSLVALSVKGKALENITDAKLQVVHDSIKKKLGALKPCYQQCSAKQRNVKKWCSICELWRIELQTYMTGLNTQISWNKMKSWEWPLHHKNIADVFTATDWDTSNLNLKDVSTNLNIWKGCKEFPGHFVQFSKSLLKARNKLFHVHAPNLCMTSQEMTSVFRAIHKVLNHGNVIPLIQNYNEVAKAIKELEQGDLHGHEADALNELKKIAGTNEKMLAKLNNFQSNFDRLEKKTMVNCYLAFVIPIFITCVFFPYMQKAGDTVDDFAGKENYVVDIKNESYGCLSERPHRLLKDGINMELYLVRDNRFVGRNWLFDDLAEKIVNESMSRGVVMVADMGYGKSAIVAQIVCSNELDVSFKLRKRLVAYYICKFDVQLSQRSNTFIKRVSSMIAQRFTQFAHVLEKDRACLANYDSDTCEQDPFGCMDQCLIAPLRKIQLVQNEKYIIAIDALDECEDKDGDNAIFDLLNSDRMKQIPNTFKFIITSRNITAYYALATDFSFMRLRNNDDFNLKDISLFINASNKTQAITGHNFIMHNLSNFLLVSSIAKNPESFEEATELPKSIYKFYWNQFKRLFGKQYDQPKAILEILCAAPLPPTENYIQQIMQVSTDITNEQFLDVMKKFQYITTLDLGPVVHLAHMSLKMWLISNESGRYGLDITRGHMRHALYLFDNLSQNKPVDLVDIAIHISHASSRSKLMDKFHRISQSKVNESQIIVNDLPHHRLIKQCDCDEAIEVLHYHFPNVNELNQAGMSPLYLAASLGRTKIVRYLLKHNADINFRLRSYANVIHLGLAADISFHDRHWGYGIMDIAAQNNHLDIIGDILVTDVTISRYSFYKMNDLNLLPIHLACKVGHTNIVKIIVEHMANMLDDLCLYLAAENGNANVVKFALNKGIEDTCRTCTGNLYWVPENKRRIQGKDLLSADGYSKKDYVLFCDWHLIMCETALHAAVKANKITTVNLLISQPSNALNCSDRSGRTPLISAIVYNHREIFDQIVVRCGFDVHLKCQKQNDIAYSSQLSEIEQNNLHTSMCDSELPVLHIAGKCDRLWVFHKLEQMGVSWTEIPRDSEGCHVAHVVACHGSLRVLDKIKSVEENILHLHCKNGSDPLHSALTCGSFEAVDYLIKKVKRYLIFHRSNASNYLFTTVKVNVSMETADDAKETVEKSFLICQSLIDNGFLLSVTDQYERNIFHYAISNGHYKIISELLDKTNENDGLLDARDIYGKTPLIHGLENLPLTNTVKLFITANYTKYFNQLSATLSPQEYSCFNILSYMKIKRMLKEGLLKKVMKLLVQKRRLSLFTAIFIYIDFNFDPALINYMIIHDRSNIFLSNYIMSSILKPANEHSSFLFELLEKLLLSVNCKLYSLPCTLHELAEHCHFKISMPKTYKNPMIDWNHIIATFVFNTFKKMPSFLLERLDYEGYNVLERAVQGSNVELVKQFIKMKIKINRKAEDVLVWPIFGNKSKSSVTVFKDISDNLITFEIQDQDMIFTNLLNYTGKSQAHQMQYLTYILKNDFDFFKGYYRQMHDEKDTILAILLTENRKIISKEFICSHNSRNFSFVHLAAMQGYSNTLRVIRKYWGPSMIQCTNADKFTPLYLAKLFDNKVIITYLEKHQVETRTPERNAEVHFIFKIWSRFLLNRNRKKTLYCLNRLRRNTITNIHAGYKAFRCIKRSAEAFGILDKMTDDLAELKSILVFVSNVNGFKHYYDIIRIIWRLKSFTFEEHQIHMNSFKYYLTRARNSCRIASKALFNAIPLSIKRRKRSKCSYNVGSIGYMKEQALFALLNFGGEYFGLTDCVNIFVNSMGSTCPGLSQTNMIKRALSSSKSNLRQVIKQLLSSIVMHTVNFYFTSVYFSQRVMPDNMFVSGVWLWDHHLYGYMDIIQNMKFYQETFMISEGLSSEYLRMTAEIGKSANYLQWSKNARTLIDQFTNKLKHG
ncbi:uncharacterized protein LOC123563889 [Mercenaria mercenaria]|uniref:uncharacterized protein LOC123563889 n=1 Tax=Mercenaria mercenaria TaxID=6596 RepID=UPI00234E4828|nr:uncharacterized protein LOC123563889 [Mercenaria mercenaria]